MNKIVEVIEREISHLDYLLILHVKSLRDDKEWTQQELSKRMGAAISFVGNVENLNERHKYSIRHLAILYKVFGFNSMSKLFNFTPPTHDKVILKIKLTKSIDVNNKSRIIKTELKEVILSDKFKL